MKKRILSLVLAILMIVSILPAPTHAADVTEETTQKHPMMGELVAINFVNGKYYDNPGTYGNFIASSYFADRMEIVAVDESTGTTYYQVNAAPNCAWKADSLGNVLLFDGIWVKASDTIHLVYCEDCKEYNCGIDHEPSAEGECIITDANGNVIDPSAGVSFVQYSKLELNAQSALEGTVSYQWQIEYEEGKWVDIYGEDSRTINLSYGMVASLLNDEGMVNIRCRSTSGSAVSYSAIIPVTMEMYTLEKPDVVVTESCVTSSGETVYVTLAGTLPEDGFVTMEETDADDVEVRPTETVVAALDISVLNLNGTPWQPESGETVTVTLEASKLGMKDGQRYVVYHQHNGVVTALGAYDVADGIIKFVVDGFSKFVFTELEMLTTTEDLQADVTKKATINDERYTNLWLVKSPETVTAYTGQWYVQANEGVDYAKGIKFKISGAYVSSVYPYGVFYQVEALNSEDLLTDKLQENPWVFQRYQDEPVEDGTLILQESEGPELPEIPEAPDFSSHIGKHAHLTQSDTVFTLVLDEEPSADNIDNSTVYMITDFSTDFTLKIDGYKVIAKIDAVTSAETGEMINYLVTQSLWYKVSVVKGSSSKEFEDGWWVYQGYIINGDVLDGAFTLFDAPVDPEEPTDPSEPTDPTDPSEPTEPEEPSVGVTVDGQPVQEITVSTSEKVTLTATPNVEGTTTYQWQILISAANMWVNISGQNTAECTVNYGMVANRLDAEGKAYIRCKTVFNGTEVISDPIAVLIGEDSADATMQASSSSTSDAAEDDGESENKTIYNVVIQYVFADGKQAANPWTATIEAGGNFSKVIASPNVVGYTPDKAEINMDIQGISADVNYTVTYLPAEVDFVVIHKVQNWNNEEYTEVERTNHKGFTDSPVGEGLAYPEADCRDLGIYALPYDIEQKISADGSTAVVITYDRYYYLMTFNLGGGVGVEPIYARVGTPITGVAEPTRLGYVFAGWNPALPGNMPAEDTVITAKWTASDTTYTVVYWAENANDSNYSFWDYKTVNSVSGSVVSGSDDFNGTTELPKTGFHFDHADQSVTVEGDGSTVVNVYYNRDTYTLYFIYDAGEVLQEAHRNHNNCNLICNLSVHEHSSVCCDLGGWHRLHNCNTNKCAYGYEHEHVDACYDCGKAISTQTLKGMKFEGIKYGQDTSNWWKQAPAYRWKTTSDGNTAYTYAPAMPNNDLYVYGQTLTSSYQYTIHYYEEGTTNKVHEDNVYYRSSDGYYLTEEDYIAIPGFVCLASGNEYPDKDLVYTIYYRRLSYTLTFKNGSETKEAGSFLYQADLSGQYYIPQYTGDDKLGYTFGGWYTTEKCIDGTEWDPEGATMPYNNLILYAKWVPVTHEVKLYVTEADWESGNQYLDTMNVSHNTLAQVPARPSNGSYNFVGWFYVEDGVEKAFDFDIPVVKDLELYGKWVADELAQYTIKYAIKNSDGSRTYIADDTKGNALAGVDKTFEAKSGSELYGDYQVGYYPETNSHSMNILLDNDNTYTFIYVPKDEVQYMVRYLEKGTEKVLATEKVAMTREAVHAENFVYVQGYRPDAYQKRIVLSANAEDNVITFWYEADKTHAPVLVKHYLQNVAGNGYNTDNPYLTTTDLDGVIGSAYEAEIIDYLEGFAFADAEASYGEGDSETAVTVTIGEKVVSAVVTEQGLLIELYYDRIPYPYEFRFLEQGTNVEVAAPINGTAIYGSQVTQATLAIPGYTCSTTNHSITIQIEEGTTAVKNVRTFYYVEETVTIQYQAVGGGKVDPTQAANIPVLSGTANGSLATPNAGYRFVGWYTNIECTKAVDNSWISGATITPQKTKAYGDKLGYEFATYYAKFEEIEVTINYEVVGPKGATNFGSVSPTTETVPVVTGNPASTATVGSGAFKFVGWYSDEACTNLITTDATFKPQKVDGFHVAATYYAKFEYNLTSLTIKKVTTDKNGNVVDYSEIDPNQSFIFDIYDKDDDTLVATVTVNSATGWKVVVDGLTVGKHYTVTERTDWSWRYNCTGWGYKGDNGTVAGENATASITLGLNATVTFTNTRGNEQWLDGDSWCNNIFK